MGEIDEVKLRPMESIGALCLSEHMADIHFICNNNDGSICRIPGHKFYLSMVCPTFRTQFFGSLPEQSDVQVTDDGITADTFKLMLKYLYCKSIQLDIEQALALLYLGKKYLLRPLQDLCTAFIVDQLQHYTPWCLHLLQQLHDLQADTNSGVMQRALKLVDVYAESTVTSDSFLILSEVVLALLLNRDTLDVDEVTLYRMVIQWSEKECKRRYLSLTVDNQRAVLHNILPLIRFTAVNKYQFQLMMRVCRILPEDDITNIINGEHKSQRPFCAQLRRLSKKQIWIIGGCVRSDRSHNWTSAVRTYSLESRCQLTTLHLTAPIADHCAVYSPSHQQVFIIGGRKHACSQPYMRPAEPQVSSYVHHGLPKFTQFVAPEFEKFRAPCICIGERLYAMGSSSSTNTNIERIVCEAYNMQLGTWTKIASLPEIFDYASCVLYEKVGKVSILLLGGITGGGDDFLSQRASKQVFEYLPDCDQWRNRVDLQLPTDLRDTATVVYNGEVVVIGGVGTHFQAVATSKCYRLDRENEEWVRMPQLHTARSGHQAVVMHGKIVVMGGDDQQRHTLKSVEVFDGERWTYGPALDAPTNSFAAVVI